MRRIASAILAALSVHDFGALDEAGKSGGEVIVPPGRYVSGSLVLHARATLRLEKGATLIPTKE